MKKFRLHAHALCPAAAILLLGVGGCPPSAPPAVPTVVGEPYAATITIESGAGRPVNRLALGTGIQWNDRGDNVIQSNSTRFDGNLLDLLMKLRPTVLRYPGGSQGDTYHWKGGVGAKDQRKENELFFAKGKSERVLFGTEEFLRLADTLGAEPLITVNLASGTADEAADWVRLTNVTRLRRAAGAALPAVHYWELDNEPYLKQDARPDLHVSAEEFAKRANAAIRAMRAVDRTIAIGLPLRSDTLGTIALPQQTPKFAETVLRGVTEPFDFVALHDAYFPFIWDPRARDTDEEIFRATMAAPRVVARDIEHVRSLLSRYKPGRRIGIAVTEYNALYSLGGPRDGYIASLGGALYVADLLRLFAQTDDLVMANYWSAANNWYFGLVGNQLPFSLRPEPRPSYHVMRAYGEVLRGRLQPLAVRAPTFDSKQVGMIPAQTGTPLVSALATVEGGVRRMLVINKDPSRPVDLTVAGTAGSLQAISVQELSSPTLFDPGNARKNVQWRPRESPSPALPFTMRFPPHSIAWIELRAAP